MRGFSKAWLLSAGLALGLGALTSGPALAVPPGTLPFGVYDPDGDFTDDMGVEIEHLFLPWEDVNLATLVDADNYAQERHRALVITIEPWTWTRNARNTPQVLEKSLLDGKRDENMRAVCQVINTLKSPVSVRWGQEMETHDGQFIWAGWDPDTYIKAYRRIISICREEAPRIKVIWSPLGNKDAEKYYPGDDYVDIVGLSIFGYEPWDKLTLNRPQIYDDLLRERYDNVKNLGKPVVVAELGYSGSQGYVDDWEGRVRQPHPDMPLLVGVLYFDQQEVYPWPDNVGKPDWRIHERVLK